MPGPEGTYWITKRNKRQVTKRFYCAHFNWSETEMEACETVGSALEVKIGHGHWWSSQM